MTGKSANLLAAHSEPCAYAYDRHVLPTGPAVAVPVHLFAFRELRKKSGPHSRFATEKRASEPEVHSCLWVLFLASSLSTQRRREQSLICHANSDSYPKPFAQVSSSFLMAKKEAKKATHKQL